MTLEVSRFAAVSTAASLVLLTGLISRASDFYEWTDEHGLLQRPDLCASDTAGPPPAVRVARA